MSNEVITLPEILAPAGQLEKLKTACLYGADAVYCGGPRFGLRSGADNFSHEELSEGVSFAKQHGVKVYITLNAFLHEQDLEGLEDYLAFLEGLGVSGLIISDPGVMSIAQRCCKIPLHVSTQASCLNVAAARMWKDLGAVRIITGRELSVEEGGVIKAETGLELEMFIHGAMCSAYSGQCTISNYTAGRDSNRGGCKQSCRFEYQKDGEGERQTLMSSKDLNGLSLVGDFVKHSIDSLKIEGRMKSSLYVASCCKAYREALDALASGEPIPKRCFDELESFSHRGYTEASLVSPAGADSIVSGQQQEDLKFSWMGQVIDVRDGMAWVQLKNPVKKGDVLEVVTFRGENVLLNTEVLYGFDGQPVEQGKQESVLCFKGVQKLEKGCVIRRAS